ncbi:MAG: hypothetical protein ACRDZP_06475 [Acidimicrobiales bacterium]
MELSPLIEGVSEDLRRAGAVGDEQTRRVAELLIASVESSIRLRLLDALHTAASELASSVPGAEVDVRLEGRDPVLSLVLEDARASAGTSAGSATYETPAEGELARLTLRLPEALKAQIERAASRAGMSVNAWLADAAARGLQPAAPFSGRRGPRRMTGFVQG